MSPEQARSTKNVDERTDIWALGVLLFESVSGRLPFTGQGFELLMNITTEKPQILDESALALPAGLSEIIGRCLERDLNKRYGNLADLAADLASLADAEGKHAARRIATLLGRIPGPSKLGMLDTPAAVTPGDASSEKTTTQVQAAIPPAAKPSSGRSWLRRQLLAAAIGLVVLAAAVAVVIKARRYPRDRSPSVLEPAAAPTPTVSESQAPPRPSPSREATAGHGVARATPSSDSDAEAKPAATPAAAKAKATTAKDASGPGKAQKKSAPTVKKKGGRRHSAR
jgi:serine/threonine-protein kinase